jgi:hypothetical protein
MEIAKDLFLTDGRAPHLAIAVASRDLEGHRLLSALTGDERGELHRLMNEHGAAVRRLLGGVWARLAPDADTASFSCGT